MAVFLFELIAILAFWKLADRNRLQELVPILLTGGFLRFLEHFIIIDWLRIWILPGGSLREVWLPISADLTVWPVSVYLFIQFLPTKNRLRYILLWSLLLTVYLQILLWLHAFSMHKGWTIVHSYFVITVYFVVIYNIWCWLRQCRTRGVPNHG